MLGLEQWNSTLSSITGTLVRGTERVTSSALFNALEVGPDPSTRQKVGKRLVSHMRRLGWNGPRAMRIPGTTGAVQGYGGVQGSFHQGCLLRASCAMKLA
jgi:hypothetical protein